MVLLLLIQIYEQLSFWFADMNVQSRVYVSYRTSYHRYGILLKSIFSFCNDNISVFYFLAFWNWVEMNVHKFFLKF